MVRFWVASALALGLVLGSVTRAAADPSSKAQVLFDEARLLMERGDYERACPMFAESQRVDPGGGTLLNLAMCHEKQGKLASAWTEFNAALSLAQRDERKDRYDLARQRLDELTPRVPRLVVVVPQDGDATTMTVRVDGAEIRKDAWGVAFPVDPGQHRIDAVAPGKRRFATAIALRPDGVTLTVEIPALETETRQEPAPRAAPVPSDAGASRSSLFYVGIATAGAGLGTSAVTGVLAWLAHESAATKCNRSTHLCSDATGIDDASRARTFAWTSTIALGIGLAGAAIAIFAPSLRKSLAPAAVAFSF